MPMFDDPRAFAELSELLADERTTIDLITLQASPVRGEVPAGRTFASRRLRVSEQVQSDFVRAAARTLRSFARRVAREYYPGWVSIDAGLPRLLWPYEPARSSPHGGLRLYPFLPSRTTSEVPDGGFDREGCVKTGGHGVVGQFAGLRT